MLDVTLKLPSYSLLSYLLRRYQGGWKTPQDWEFENYRREKRSGIWSSGIDEFFAQRTFVVTSTISCATMPHHAHPSVREAMVKVLC